MTDGDEELSSTDYHLSLAIETIGYHRAYMRLLADQLETLIAEHDRDGAVPNEALSELVVSLGVVLAGPDSPPDGARLPGVQ